MNKYDVVVIGAGNGGLAAACKVLNAGKSCLVLEKHNLPGGFATSFVRGRFEFEASLHEFNGIGTVENPGSSRILFDELGVGDKIESIQSYLPRLIHQIKFLYYLDFLQYRYR